MNQMVKDDLLDADIQLELQTYGYQYAGKIDYKSKTFKNFEINYLKTKDFLLSDMLIADEHDYETVIRLYEMPLYKLYIIALSRRNEKGEEIGQLTYAFPSKDDLYSAIPFANNLELSYLSDYIVTSRIHECIQKKYRVFNDKQDKEHKLLKYCKFDKGIFKVTKWGDFLGVYAPKEIEFIPKNQGITYNLRTIGIKPIDKKLLQKINQLNEEAYQDIVKKIKNDGIAVTNLQTLALYKSNLQKLSLLLHIKKYYD
ncbi:MAG: hypothetical protein ACI4V7_01995 [Succinivibrionaceae bacterium]